MEFTYTQLTQALVTRHVTARVSEVVYDRSLPIVANEAAAAVKMYAFYGTVLVNLWTALMICYTGIIKR